MSEIIMPTLLLVNGGKMRKSAVFLPILTAVALLTVLSLSTACGGDGEDELTLDTYFQRLEVLDSDAERKIDDVAAKSVEELEQAGSVSERGEAMDKFMSAWLPIMRDYTSDLGDLNPPSEAQDAHDAMVTALKAGAEEIEDVAGKFSQVQSQEEFDSLVDDSSAEAAFNEIGETCSRLQTVANDNNIAVDLDC